MKDTRFLLTGATGFLGREFLVRLLRQGCEVLVTMRRKGDSDTPRLVRERIEEVVAQTAPGTPTATLRSAFADVSEPLLGLSDEAVDWLAGSGRAHVVHGAAQVRFDKPLWHMYEQNVWGTQNAIDLAWEVQRRCGACRFDYVSTCYVAGARSGLALESEIDVGQHSRNYYELTKLDSERRVDTAHRRGLPVSVYRPSIIVGDSRTGKASSFKVLYWPLGLYARGRWRTIFGCPECPVDVVPVDYVADAMVALVDEPDAVGRTFHLAAGPERQSTIDEVVGLAQRFFDQKPVRYFDPDIYLKYLRRFVRPVVRKVRPDVGELGGVYLPYLKTNPSFSVDEATRLLAPKGVMPPKVSEYFDVIFRYARATDFGRALS